MFYLQKFRQNIFNPAYYRVIMNQPLSGAFKYYLKLSLWLVLLYTAFVSAVFLPNALKLIRQTTFALDDAYPVDLKIHLSGGRAAVNLPEPVIIPLPGNLSKLFNSDSSKTGKVFTNFAVIDTRKPLVPADFDSFHSIFVLGQDALATDSGGDLQVKKVPADTNLIIDKGIISSVAAKARTFITIMTPLSVLVVYLLGLLFFTVNLLPILAIAFLAWLLLLLAPRPAGEGRPNFGSALAVTLHAVTLSLVANFFTFLVYPSLAVNFPFMATFTLLIVYINLIRKPKLAFVPPTPPKNIPEDTITEPKEEASIEEKIEENIEPKNPA